MAFSGLAERGGGCFVQPRHPLPTCSTLLERMQGLWEIAKFEDLTFGCRQSPRKHTFEQLFSGVSQPLPITEAGVGMETVKRHFMQGNGGAEGG